MSISYFDLNIFGKRKRATEKNGETSSKHCGISTPQFHLQETFLHSQGSDLIAFVVVEDTFC